MWGSLRRRLVHRFFDRHGGRWVLHEEGRLFAPKASQSILYARMGLDLVQSHVKLQTNRLFAGYSTFLHPRLMDVIKRASKQASSADHRSCGPRLFLAGATPSHQVALFKEEPQTANPAVCATGSYPRQLRERSPQREVLGTCTPRRLPQAAQSRNGSMAR